MLNYDREEERTANSTFVIGGVSSPLDSFVLRNRQLLVVAKPLAVMQ